MGFNKTALEYGAFPPDPYSHTPKHAGARQPGMTGQTKEDILARWGELGVSINNGQYMFQPTLLQRREFLNEGKDWRIYDIRGESKTIYIPKDCLAFTIGMTPVIYILTPLEMQIRVYHGEELMQTIYGNILDSENSMHIINRSNDRLRIEVLVPESMIHTE
jgi:hypothetical protein